MNLSSLSIVMKSRNLSQSDIARLAGISRQAVSLWFRAGDPEHVNVQSKHLEALSRALKIDMNRLVDGLTVSSGDASRSSLEASVIWDRLFPSLEDFAIAVTKGDPRALARLVQAEGLYGAEKIAGKQVWRKFNAYEKYLVPTRRRELKRLWTLESRLAKR